MTTPAEANNILSARGEAVRSRLPTGSAPNISALAQGIDALAAAISVAEGVRGQCIGVTSAACTLLPEMITRQRYTLTSAQLTYSDWLRGQIGGSTGSSGTGSGRQTSPGTSGRSSGGGGGGGGSGLPAPATGGSTELTTWDALFGGDAPWYQKPGYLIGGAVALGTVAIVLSFVGKKKASSAKAETQEA